MLWLLDSSSAWHREDSSAKSFSLGPYHIRLVCELHFRLVHRELLTSSPWLRVLSVRRHYLWFAALVEIQYFRAGVARPLTAQLGL